MNNFEELERLYVPSYHTRRFGSRKDLLDHFQKFSSETSYKNRTKYECHLNIAYGDSKREKLDIYGEHLRRDSPLMIYVHGGYWAVGDKEDYAFVIEPFITKGVRVMIVDHSLNIALENIVAEMKKCFMWIADYATKNEIKKLSVVGHCAGAHLISYALSEEFFDALSNDVTLNAFFLSGIYYLDEMRYFEETNKSNVLKITDENVKQLSPLFRDYDYLLDYNFRAHIYVGAFESEKFKEHSRLFAERLSPFLVNYRCDLQVDHFNMVENLSDLNYELTKTILDCFQK